MNCGNPRCTACYPDGFKPMYYFLDPGSITITDMKYNLSQFTIHNGCFPTAIFMDSGGIDKYRKMLKGQPNSINELTFMGIPVREI